MQHFYQQLMNEGEKSFEMSLGESSEVCFDYSVEKGIYNSDHLEPSHALVEIVEREKEQAIRAGSFSLKLEQE